MSTWVNIRSTAAVMTLDFQQEAQWVKAVPLMAAVSCTMLSNCASKRKCHKQDFSGCWTIWCKEQAFLHSVHSALCYNVGNHFRETESQETMCSLIHVCLSIIHSFKKKKGGYRWKRQLSLCCSTSLTFPVPNFDPYWAWPQLGKYDLASFITEQRYQWSKWVWDASAAAPSLPSPWKWTPDYWTGKLMYSLHQPLDGKLPPADVATVRLMHTVTVSCGATFTVWGTSCAVSRRCLHALLLSQDKFKSTWFIWHLKPSWTDSVWVMQIPYQLTVEAEPNPTYIMNSSEPDRLY